MEFQDRVSAYPNRYLLTDENGNTSYVHLERADEPTVPGTPLSAENMNSLLQLSGGTMTGDINMGGNAIAGLPDVYTIYKGAGDAVATRDFATAMGIPAGGNTSSGIDIDTTGQGYVAVSASNPIIIGGKRYYNGHILTFAPYGQATRVQLYFNSDGFAAFRVAWYTEPYASWHQLSTTAVATTNAE